MKAKDFLNTTEGQKINNRIDLTINALSSTYIRGSLFLALGIFYSNIPHPKIFISGVGPPLIAYEFLFIIFIPDDAPTLPT